MASKENSQINQEEMARDPKQDLEGANAERMYSDDKPEVQDQGPTATDNLKIGNAKADQISSNQQEDEVGRDHWRSPQ